MDILLGDTWRLGLSGAQFSFCKLVRKLFEGLDDFCAAYLDDIIIFSTSWELHLEHLAVVLEMIANAHLTLNRRKCVFANAELDFLGHHITLKAIQRRIQKVDAVIKFPRPRNRKQVQSLLGFAGIIASIYRAILS